MSRFERPESMLERVGRERVLPEELGAPHSLRCEYLENPLGIDAARPRLSWQVTDGRQYARQTGYQIQVAEAPFTECGAVLWDTDRVDSADSIQIAYEGPNLVSGRRYHWRARTWDADGDVSDWSETAWWEMGLLSGEDWRGEWLSPPPLEAPEPLELGQWIWHPDRTDTKEQVGIFSYTLELPEAGVGRAHAQVGSDVTFKLEINGSYVASHYDSSLHGAEGGPEIVDCDLHPFLRPGANEFVITARSHQEQPHVVLGARVECGGETFVVKSSGDWRAELALHGGKPPYRTDPPSERAAVELGRYERHFNAPWPLRTAALMPAHCFRKTFVAGELIKRARAYICGLGYHELYLNGRRVGDSVLEPAQTNYREEALYVTHDVTDQLARGENVVGVHLADGWYNQSVVWGGLVYGDPILRCMVMVEYEDGGRETFATDGGWRCHASPVVRANVYWGETYDARREMNGWCEAGFDDSEWDEPRVLPSPTQRLRPQLMPPIKKMQVLSPVGMQEPAPGVFVFDMGQNLAGWARIHVKSAPGRFVTLRFAEMTDPNGMLWMETTGTPHTHVDQTDVYICRGGGEETYEPRFTYHGFRYVEVTGLDEAPRIEAVVVHTAVLTDGTFHCSDETLNRIHEMALWTEVSNLHGVPTDCPVRERCGWLGDAHVSAEMTIYNFDMAQFWTKYLSDVVTSMEEGRPTMIAPGQRTCGLASVDWGTALVQVPWYLYVYYGDRRILEEIYPYWRPWIEHMVKNGGNRWVLEGGFEIGLGDWCPPGGNEHIDTPVPFTTTAYFYLDAWIAQRVASMLGKDDDAVEFARLAERIKAALIWAFYDRGNSTFGTQTADSMALAFGLVPEGSEQAVADSLAGHVADRGGHLHVGIMGARFVNEVLTDHGHDHVIYEAMTKADWPGIPYIMSLGATTLWEQFGAGDDTDQFPVYSLNHPMQGGYDAWFYAGIAGIRPSADHAGFRHMVLRPGLVRELEFAEARYASPYGIIESKWQRDGENFEWRIVVPPNTTATVQFPACDVGSILQDGGIVHCPDGVFDIGAGTYRFNATLT